jgi:hypothetical protein
MENIEHELREWRETPEQLVSTSSLAKHKGLQPRDPRSTSSREVPSAEAASKLHIERLQDVLRANSTAELDPLLVARIEGKLFVVDGHHRLAAYQRAQRPQVRARVRTMSLQRASLLSKLVNNDGIKLPLTRGQSAESAWQYVTTVTARGRLPLPAGDSFRKVAARFGVASHETIRGMLQRVPAVAERLTAGDFPSQWCDAATGWPMWVYVRSELRDRFGQDMASDVRHQRQLERCARGIAKLLATHDRDVFRKAYAEVTGEGLEDADGAADGGGDF